MSPVPSSRYPAGVDPSLDRLARLVASEAFAVAFLWWSALVVVGSTCLVWCLHHYRSGTITLALGFGFAGLLTSTMALSRLAALAPRLRSSAAA